MKIIYLIIVLIIIFMAIIIIIVIKFYDRYDSNYFDY